MNKKYAVKEILGSWRIVDSKTGKPAINARAMPVDGGGFTDAFEAKRRITSMTKAQAKLNAMRTAIE